MRIKLRNYQQEAIDRMFGNKDEKTPGLYDEKRFAAVFLPTGGGKSFVSMEAMNRVMTVNNETENPYLISDTPMLYLSPNTPIIGQYQIHMAQNMIFEHHISRIESRQGETSREQIKDVATEVLRSFHPNVVIDNQVMDTIIEKNPELSADKLLRLVLKSQLTSQDSKIIEGTQDKDGNWIGGVRGAFPKIQFKCYQAMRSKKAKDVIDGNDSLEDSDKLFYVEEIKADFVIMDEAHRGAAQEWSSYLEKLVDSHEKSKFLAITATPDRDADDYSIINTIASKTGYTTREVRKKEYTAQYLELIEAMKQGLVVTPKVVHLNCTLDQTKAYREVVAKLEELNAKKATVRGNKNAELGNTIRVYEAILGRMHALMGREPGMTDEQWKEKQSQLISEAIRESGLKEGAKCIGFIPKTEAYRNPQEHIRRYADEIQARLMSGLGLPKERVYSKGYHSELSQKDNEETLRTFNRVEGNSSGVKVILTNAKLNEGVHVDDTQALFMYDEIRAENASVIKQTPKIKFMQQMGRCIFSVDPNSPKPESPLIFDMAHNFLWQHHLLKDADGNPFFNITPEEAEFIELYNIFLHNPMQVGYRMPSNLAQSRNVNVVEEAIKAGTLNFTFKEKDENGKQIKIDFPEGKPEITPNLVRRVNQEKGKKYNSKGLPLTELAGLKVDERFKKLEAVLKVLKKYKIDVQNIDESIPLSEEFFEANGITRDKMDDILDEIYDLGPGKSIAENFEGLVYPLGEEMKVFRDAFYGLTSTNASVKKVAKRLLDKKSFQELSNLGIISVDLLNIPEELKECVSEKGFIIPNENIPEKYWGLNIVTGTRYIDGRDEFGLDANGYDVYGYDKDGFNREGIHKITGQDFDERFFRKEIDSETGEVKWTNIITNKEVDTLGYNHEGIEPDTGFDRGIVVGEKLIRFWHEKIGKVFSRLGKSKNNDGVDQHGFSGKRIADSKYGSKGSEMDYGNFYVDGTHHDGYYEKNSKGVYEHYPNRNKDGYDIDGYDIKGFKEAYINGKKIKVHRDTSWEYGPDGKDVYGKVHPDVELANKLIEDIILRKISSAEVYKKYSAVKDIDSRLNNAMTVYAMSPKMEFRYPEKLIMDNIEEFDVIGKLSPKLMAQMQERTRYKQAVLKELENKRAQQQAKGKELDGKENMIKERIEKIKSSIIVRDFDEER